MHRIVCNLNTGEVMQVALTPEEISELEARAAAYVEPPPPAPTKEQLMAELAALAAKIQALE